MFAKAGPRGCPLPLRLMLINLVVEAKFHSLRSIQHQLFKRVLTEWRTIRVFTICAIIIIIITIIMLISLVMIVFLSSSI